MMCRRNTIMLLMLLFHSVSAGCGRLILDPDEKLMNDAVEGSVGGVRLAILAGANVNERWPQGKTTLIWTCAVARSDDHGRIVKLLIESGADPNMEDENGFRALSWAPIRGRIDIVKSLLAAGADVNAQAQNGWTALMAAAQGGHPDVVRLLLENGATLETRDENGKTALDLAARFGHSEVVELLRASRND